MSKTSEYQRQMRELGYDLLPIHLAKGDVFETFGNPVHYEVVSDLELRNGDGREYWQFDVKRTKRFGVGIVMPMDLDASTPTKILSL